MSEDTILSIEELEQMTGGRQPTDKEYEDFSNVTQKYLELYRSNYDPEYRMAIRKAFRSAESEWLRRINASQYHTKDILLSDIIDLSKF